MKLIIVLAAVGTLAWTGCASHQPMAAASMQTPQSFEKTVTKKVRANYLLYLPRDYSATSKKSWPLMLFLHGAGERGTNLTKVAAHGPPKLVAQGRKDLPFIIVSPQCPAGERWRSETLIPLLDEVITKYRVDTNRLYLTG